MERIKTTRGFIPQVFPQQKLAGFLDYVELFNPIFRTGSIFRI